MNFKSLFLAATALLVATTGVQASCSFCREDVTACYSDCAQSAEGSVSPPAASWTDNAAGSAVATVVVTATVAKASIA
ncbi:hypothetical protein HDV05_006570 [Chytridiales sp. JEL 0842]|nr:hypothetical protein HDV05_006570 [Chytridiales sp. JEL 0842]